MDNKNSYRPFRLDGDTLCDNGTVDRSPEQIVDDFPVSDGWVCPTTNSLPADFSVETYTIEDGQLVKAPAELIAERQAAKTKAVALVEIKELQAYLTSTDYAAIKCGELGLAMADTYPDLHAGRTAARARINALQEGGAE